MTSTLLAFLVAPLAAALAAASYFRGGPAARPPAMAVAGRVVAWTAAALLLVNPSCAARVEALRPLVLLDTSASMEAVGGAATRARPRADSLGDVRPFAGSRLGSALEAAVATGRPVIVVTDGELLDAARLTPAMLRGVGIDLLPRSPVPDLAIVAIEGPGRVAQGDSLVMRATVRSVGTGGGAVSVELAAGQTALGRATATVPENGAVDLVLDAGVVRLPPGEHLLDLRLTGSADADPRTDRRTHLLTVTETPGIVLIAPAAGWEARFLYRALVDVSRLPVQGYVQLQAGAWHRMQDLAPVAAGRIRQAVANADLLVTLGPVPEAVDVPQRRARWEWTTEAAVPGDWYLTAEALSPVSSALSAVPAESLPPATALAAAIPPPGGWIGAAAQAGRRGAARPAIAGSEESGRRRLVIGASGLWRWAFRGGAAEQAYRALVGSAVAWLVGEPGDRPANSITLARPVVERDEPLVFVAGAGVGVASLPVALDGPGGPRVDTLRFGADGRAALALPPGRWRYRLEDGANGLVAVEEYSSEFLPGTVTVEARAVAHASPGLGRGARDVLWLYGLGLLAFCVEWAARRRAGMR